MCGGEGRWGSLLSSGASCIIRCQRLWEYNIDGPMGWSNMANPIFLLAYKWITSYSSAHIQQNDEREKKTNGISWSLHSTLFLCPNFVSEFNVCRRQLMALKEKERKMLKPQTTIWALLSLVFFSCWNPQLGCSCCRLQRSSQHFRAQGL